MMTTRPSDQKKGHVMGEDRPSLPDRQAADWEDSVETELAALRREVERLNHELIKVGGQTAQLMRERAERHRHAKGARR
jgi:hypothetical protein